MITTIEQLEKVLDSQEGEHCEFKEAANNGTRAFKQSERTRTGLIQLKKRRSAIWRNATLVTT